MGSTSKVVATNKKKPKRQEYDDESTVENGLDINTVPKISSFKCASSVSNVGARKFKLDSFLPEISEENIEKEKPKTRKKRGRPRKSK